MLQHEPNPNRDRNFKHVEKFSPALSEYKETADIVNDTTAGVCLHDAKSMVFKNFQRYAYGSKTFFDETA